MLQRGRFLCAFLLIIVLSSFAFAAEFTVSISNSEKWQEVYSTMLIAGLQDADSEFLVSTAHGPILANGISSAHTAFIVSSEDAPFVFNYADTLRARGFRSVEEIFVDNANLDLLEEELPDIQNFIIVSNDAGHNAVAVVQYAKKTNSWVFLADRANIADISQLLSERDVNLSLIHI